MCFGRPAQVNRPELRAAYLLGGNEAVEAMGGNAG